MNLKSKYLVGCALILFFGCSVDDESGSNQTTEERILPESQSSSDQLPELLNTISLSTNLSYSFNPGAIKSIKFGGNTLTTGGGYNSVLSCDGPDNRTLFRGQI